jgi:hypothetical protein
MYKQEFIGEDYKLNPLLILKFLSAHVQTRLIIGIIYFMILQYFLLIQVFPFLLLKLMLN